MEYNDRQLTLFTAAETSGCYAVNPIAPLEISRDTLQAWKSRVLVYQQQVREQPLQQGSLFENCLSAATTSAAIDPFSLPQQNTEFWRWKASDQGSSALYFVIDYEPPLLLYVGETVKSGQRWKGEHDCKRYLINYRQVHYQHQIVSQLGIAFWPHAPMQTRSRQQLELSLIDRWRSPFNKENWELWGTPFTGGKA